VHLFIGSGLSDNTVPLESSTPINMINLHSVLLLWPRLLRDVRLLGAHTTCVLAHVIHTRD